MSIENPISYIKEQFKAVLENEMLNKEVYTITEGEHIITIDFTSKWDKVKTRYGERVKIPIIVQSKEYVLLLNERGKLFKQLVKTIGQEMNNRGADPSLVTVKVVKSGKGVKATYEVNIIDYIPLKEIKKEEAKNAGSVGKRRGQ
jgi:hypothetical protein